MSFQLDIIIVVLYKTIMKINNKNFLYKLSGIRKIAFSFLESEMAKCGIKDVSPSFGDILYIIKSLEEGYVKEIVDRSFKDKSTISNIINQLESKGYVEKITDKNDGRRVKVRLTEEAEKYIDAMANISKNLQKRLFNNMSTEEQEIMFLLLNKVEKNLKL